MVIKKRYLKIVSNLLQCYFFYHGFHTKATLNRFSVLST